MILGINFVMRFIKEREDIFFFRLLDRKKLYIIFWKVSGIVCRVVSWRLKERRVSIFLLMIEYMVDIFVW